MSDIIERLKAKINPCDGREGSISALARDAIAEIERRDKENTTLLERVDQLECTLEDEETAHQNTLRLWKDAKADIERLLAVTDYAFAMLTGIDDEEANRIADAAWQKLGEEDRARLRDLSVKINAKERAALDERTEACAVIAEEVGLFRCLTSSSNWNENGIAARIRALKGKA